MAKFISGDFFSTIVNLRYWNFIDFDISEDDITVSLRENIFDNKNIDFDEDNNERCLHSGAEIAEPIDTEIIKQRLPIFSLGNEDPRNF